MDDDETGAEYREQLEKIKQCIDANYERLKNGVDACATVFTEEDVIRAHAFGVRLEETDERL